MIEYTVEVMVMMPDKTWHLQTQVFTQEDEGDEAARQKAIRLTKENYEPTAYVDMTIYSFNAKEVFLHSVWVVFVDTSDFDVCHEPVRICGSFAQADAWVRKQVFPGNYAIEEMEFFPYDTSN